MATYESRKPGPNEFSFVGYPIQVAKYKYSVSDLDASSNFYAPIEAGVAVVGVAHRVTTAFAGGTEFVGLGDSSGTVAFLSTSEITATSTNDFVTTFNKTNAAAGGKYYSSANYVKVTASTELTSGAGEIFIFFVDAKTNWRTENDLS